jgi:phospholipase C
MPSQEPGVKKSRALDYILDAKMTYEGGDHLKLEISSSGKNGAPFQLHNLLFPDLFPLKYAVEGGKTLIDTQNINFDSNGNYSFSLHGPNGFVRQFSGNINQPDPMATLVYRPE